MAAPSTPPITPPLVPTVNIPGVANTAPPAALAVTTGTATGTDAFQGTASSTLQTLQTAAQTIVGSTKNLKDRGKDATLSELDAGEADIARQWHRACPTLRTIILPQGRVWFQTHREREDAGAGARSGERRSGNSKRCVDERCSCRHRRPRKATAKFKGKDKSLANGSVEDAEDVYWRESSGQSNSSSGSGSAGGSGSASGSGSTYATAAAADGNTDATVAREGRDGPLSGPSQGPTRGADVDTDMDDSVWVPL